MISIADYARQVAKMSGQTVDQLLSSDRVRATSRQRMAMMFVLRRKGRMSNAQIGRSLMTDATTVGYGYRQILNFLQRKDRETIRHYKIAIRCWVRLQQAARQRRKDTLNG